MCRQRCVLSAVLSITCSVIGEFFRCLYREKYRHPWQLMEDVAVSSRSGSDFGPSQETTNGTDWSRRVLRRFAPMADGGGVCKFTDRYPWGLNQRNSSPSPHCFPLSPKQRTKRAAGESGAGHPRLKPSTTVYGERLGEGSPIWDKSPESQEPL